MAAYPSLAYRRGCLLLIALAYAAVSVGGEPGPTKEEGILVHNGFGTGQTFLNDLSDAQRRAYAMGVINGMLISPMLGAPKEKLAWLETCAERMTDEQVAAIITKHLREHPERWHYGLHLESWAAMKDACDTNEESPKAPAPAGRK